MSASPIYFIFNHELNWHSASMFSAFISITVTLEICNMAQAKVNRELANVRSDLTSTDMSKKNNSAIHGKEENNLLLL